MIKTIVFDFEGPIWTMGDKTVFEQVSKEKGLREDSFYNTARQYFDGAHVGEFSSYEDFYTKANPQTDFSLKEFKETFDRQMATRDSVSGTIDLIKTLKPKYQIALFSNFGSSLVGYLNDLGITDLFDHIVNSYDLGVEKPDKEAYLKMLDIIGANPDEVIFVDDKSRNIEGAKAVGIKSILFTNPNQLKDDLSKLIDI